MGGNFTPVVEIAPLSVERVLIGSRAYIRISARQWLIGIKDSWVGTYDDPDAEAAYQAFKRKPVEGEK